MTRVSIIIPAFNAAATLNATIESVVGQRRSDWEAIIFDDGSTDMTADIVRAWCERDPRLRLLTGPNRGCAAARNEAARHAKSPWLLFLDADDLIREDHFALTLAAADGNPAPDIIYGAGARLTSDGRMGAPEIPPRSQHFRHLASFNLFFLNACLIRRAAFEETGGFDSTLATCADWDMLQRFARADAPVVAVDGWLAICRMRPDSMSRKAESLFDNAREVILRAHRRDSRVAKPAGEYAEGLPAVLAGAAIAEIAIWCAARMVGAGMDAASLLQRIEFAPVTDLENDRSVSMMQRGVLLGGCALQEDWTALWPMYRNSIQSSFAIVEHRCALPGFASRCMEELERRSGARLGPNDARQRTGDRIPWRIAVPKVGEVEFGDFLRLKPVSTVWGFDRGEPVDRLYIESFLQRHCEDVRGRVLEGAPIYYTHRFGGERVTRSDVLHVDAGVPNATIIADLAAADHVQSDLFDCIILTQTLQYVFDLRAAITTLWRILKPGGVLLLTAPGISQIDDDRWGHGRYWSFTAPSVRRLLLECFPVTAVEVESRGNVMSAIAFLQGLSQQDVSSLRYQVDDPLYPVIILARAAKANDGGSAKSGSLESVRRLQARLQSFLSMRRIGARRKNASALRLRFSQSLASLRQRLSKRWCARRSCVWARPQIRRPDRNV